MENDSGSKPLSKIIPTAIILIITGAIVIFVMISAQKGGNPPVYTIANGVFTIDSNYGQEIRLSDIRSVEQKTELPGNLRRTNGYGLGSIAKGKCSSDLGDLTVYLDTSKPPFIYLDTTSGLVVLNDQTAEKTAVLFEDLKSAIGQ